MKRLCEIGYRYITPSDYMTPKICIPMQRMQLEIEEPFGDQQVREALMEYNGIVDFFIEESIKDIECYPLPEPPKEKP